MERIKEWMKLHAVLVIVLLCGAVLVCQMVFQEDRNVRGVVVEIQTREDGSLASFILEQDGKRTGVLLTENTLAKKVFLANPMRTCTRYSRKNFK